MVEYISRALKQDSHEATVLFARDRSIFRRPSQEYLSGVLLRGGPQPMPKLSLKTWLKMKDQKTLEAFS
ncbi:MAG: hypothetical protein LUQ22_08215 [Methanotrichaceae archaeon]|nr:hypothetical protein [Methanotrichaceae archaeon]